MKLCTFLYTPPTELDRLLIEFLLGNCTQLVQARSRDFSSTIQAKQHLYCHARKHSHHLTEALDYSNGMISRYF